MIRTCLCKTARLFYEERLAEASGIKGIFKLETILKYRDLNVLIDGAIVTLSGKEFQPQSRRKFNDIFQY